MSYYQQGSETKEMCWELGSLKYCSLGKVTKAYIERRLRLTKTHLQPQEAVFVNIQPTGERWCKTWWEICQQDGSSQWHDTQNSFCTCRVQSVSERARERTGTESAADGGTKSFPVSKERYDDDDDEIAYFTMHWKTRELVTAEPQKEAKQKDTLEAQRF